MVSKITILEPHFDGAQFGPTAMPGESDSEMASAVDSPSSEGPGLLPLAVAGGVALALLYGARRLRRGRSEEGPAVTLEEPATEPIPAE